MPGQATITIKESQWSVSLATTYAELTTGLAGIASIAAGTGMLFVLPAEQPVSVTTQSLQFNIDIIFISSDLKVVDVAGDVAPGNVMTENTPVKYFLEVNAGEATGVAAGDTVKIEHLVTILDNVTSVIAFAIPLVALGFVSSLVGGMARVMTGSSPSAHHSLQEPSEKARRCARCGKYKEDVKYRSGTGVWLCDECFKLWPQPSGPPGSHHSMWLTMEQRKELEKKYGAVAVRWAEEATRPGDIEAADKAAAYYYSKIKEYFALGHGSPELTEEQIMKLREILGLPAEVPPRKKGYID